MTIALGPFASSVLISLATAFPRGAISIQRCSDATTSADVISLPLWNLTPLRNAIVYTRPPFETAGMLSASIGTTFELASYVYRSSYTCCMIVPTRSAVDAIGSSVCGSPIIAMLAAPPLGGAASARALTARRRRQRRSARSAL
jgi:hypothetical protein